MGDRELGVQTFRGAGEHVFFCPERHVAGAGGVMRIDFSLDKACVPPAPDGRELGVQVTFEKVGPTLRREWTHPIKLV
jgi:hypothetical protein